MNRIIRCSKEFAKNLAIVAGSLCGGLGVLIGLAFAVKAIGTAYGEWAVAGAVLGAVAIGGALATTIASGKCRGD